MLESLEFTQEAWNAERVRELFGNIVEKINERAGNPSAYVEPPSDGSTLSIGIAETASNLLSTRYVRPSQPITPKNALQENIRILPKVK